MNDLLLTPPSGWVDQIRTLSLPELVLSYYPNSLVVPAGRSLTDVARDLAAGAWLDRSRSTQDEIFRLGGTEFELRVRRQRGRDSQDWMAVALNVDEARSVPRKAGRIAPYVVDFKEVWCEAKCDLEAIEVELRRRKQHLRRDGRGLVTSQTEVRAHGWLQDEVRRQYGELRTLIEVLEQRPEQAEHTTRGTVVAERSRRRGSHPNIVVAPRTRNLDVFRGKRIQLVQADGRSFNTRVAGVRAGRLEIAEPREWSAKPSEEVSVSVVPQFGMRQNAEALKQFLSGQVEGSWDDLARLLCRSADLELPARLPSPATFYCDADPDAPDFNDEQRRAVTGAVGTPHAFLVQGPPGTGKTEVICEIVRQLAARGERVMLLAPTHVAVDEVLLRVGRKPGVRPLRITWSDDHVNQELWPFLPKNVGIELVRRVLHPVDQGQATLWEQEYRAVDERLAALAEFRDVDQRRAAAIDAQRSAAATAAATAEQLRSRTVATENEATVLRQTLAADERALAQASAVARAVVEFDEAERAELAPGLTALREEAAALVGAVSAEAAARATVTEATAALRGSSSADQFELGVLGEKCAAAERAAVEAHQQLYQAASAVRTAETRLAEAIAGQTAWSRFTERLGLGIVAAQRRALADAQDATRERRAELQDRETAWQAATVSYRNLRHRVALRRDELERRLANAQSVWNHAVTDRSAALQRLADALSSIDGAFLPDLTGTEDTALARYERFGLAVCDAVDAVLEPNAWGSRISALAVFGAVLEPVDQQLRRLQCSGIERERRENELIAIAARRDDRAAVLRRIKVDAAAEAARLTAEDAEDKPVGTGCVNEREQKFVVQACEIYNEELSRTGTGPITASVLSFYRAQAQALERQLLSRDLPMLEWKVIDVIDRIQGQQSDLVVISFVRAKGSGFGPRYGQWLQDVRRLNVACTRARRALVLVGHGETLRRLGTARNGQPEDSQARHAKQFYANLFSLFGSDKSFLWMRRL